MKNGTAPDQKWSKPDLTIFIGLREISGYYTNLSRGLRDLGYRVIFVGGGLHPFRYGSDAERAALPLIPRIYENLLMARRDAKKLRSIQLPLLNILIEIQQMIMFIWSLFTCHVYIFGYAHTFIKGGHDLAILKFLSKRVIVHVGHGSEARPPYLDGSRRTGDGKWGDLVQEHRLTRFMALRVKRIERHADFVIASPMTSQFLTRRSIDFYALGNPSNIGTPTQLSLVDHRDTVSILHAPSKPIAKGTPEIRAAVSKIKAKGYLVDYTEITGMPNADVRLLLQKTDLIIDQVYSDNPFPGLATEAAEFAKPTIIGGYGFGASENMTLAMRETPAIRCLPDKLEHLVLELIQNKERRLEQGARASEFLKNRWSVSDVAQRFKSLIQGMPDSGWYFDPLQFSYVNGVAVTESVLVAHIREYISRFGVDALELNHRPDLKSEIIKLVQNNENP